MPSSAGCAQAAPNTEAAEVTGPLPLCLGHLEYPAIDADKVGRELSDALARRRTLEDLFAALEKKGERDGASAASSQTSPPIVIYADIPLAAEHLTLLGVNVERAPGRATIPVASDAETTVAAFVKVLQVLQLRIATHEQNLRNADRIRDAEGRLNPYRRKVVRLGAQGSRSRARTPRPSGGPTSPTTPTRTKKVSSRCRMSTRPWNAPICARRRMSTG